MPTLSLEQMSVDKKKSLKSDKKDAFHGEISEQKSSLKRKKSAKESLLGDAETSPKNIKKAKKEKEKKKKKSRASDDDDDNQNELFRQSKSEDSEEEEEDESEEENEEEKTRNPNALENFRISEVLRNKLKSNGIDSLFPIQAMTYEFILQGNDLVGRARTGQGKTLAFVLPIVESLTNGKNSMHKPNGRGKPPSVIALVPTRELAKQVHADFEMYGGAVGLSACCVYGGAPYGPQENALRRGVDIVTGTPGRIKDMIEKGTLNLKFLKFRVLDEADEMLNMGFVDDVETILGKVEDTSVVQTLLFSATMPAWVKKISSKFLKSEKKSADLVGDNKMKASTSVKHIAIPCFYTARPKVIPDIIQCYSSGGRVIVFTQTKNDASELAQVLPGGAYALHGDIQQSQREVILAKFRAGKFLVLVATDVAARGLDINDVQLIIQCEPPRDVETYIHRSGRTGRAGNTGIAVLLYGKKKQYMLSQIEKEAGFKFEHLSAPQPGDIAEATGNSAVESVLKVSDSVLPIFRKTAENLIENGDMQPCDIIAKALAKIAGYTEVKRRSLLTSEEGLVTLILTVGKVMFSPTYAFNILRKFVPEQKVADVKGMSLTADSKSVVFDVPIDDVDTYSSGQGNAAGANIKVLEKLPELQVRMDHSGGSGNGRGGRGRGGRGGGHSNGGSWGRGGRHSNGGSWGSGRGAMRRGGFQSRFGRGSRG
eukprot:TRINITY_DN4463_c0_g1_i4.p1 TRINITY_DN4463_c0_g1~~TRINITY_DN4463_c0_g1_i4.p1  ORF type:complete len:711 (-),score=174.01 TRINITY_DN4463_c0_g1_i4:212-2344(-)